MDFRSDNVHEVADPVIKAIIEANNGTIASYGDDKITKKANELLSDLFDKDIFSFLVSTGTAANSLSLSAITPPFGTIFCGDVSHIYLEECNAPEFFTNSAKLFPIKTNSGKISHEELKNTIQNHPSDKFDMVASSLSISQGTECGTIYTSDEIRNIVKIAKNRDIKLHMDGARFSNVIAATDKNPADLTWKLGTDIMSFGTTKNGTLSAELIISFLVEVSALLNSILLLPVTLAVFISVALETVKLPFEPKIIFASPWAALFAANIWNASVAWLEFTVNGKSNLMSLPPWAWVFAFTTTAVTLTPVNFRVPPFSAVIVVTASRVAAVPILIWATWTFVPSIIGFPFFITTLCPDPLPMFPFDQFPASIHKLFPVLLLKYLCPYTIEEENIKESISINFNDFIVD